MKRTAHIRSGGVITAVEIETPDRPTPEPGAGKRSFEAAKHSRLTADWTPADTSIDYDIRSGLRTLRSRSRDAVQNNDYAKGYVRANCNNVPGPLGFTFQSKVKDKDQGKEINSAIEEAFADWTKLQHCTVTGTQSFRGVQHLLLKHLAGDGEYIVRKVRGRGKYGFQLQILEPDVLDEQLDKKLGDGNIIRMGVELDPWRRPVGFHVLKADPWAEMYGGTYRSGKTERLDAKDIYHNFDAYRAFQTRGIPWIASGLLRLRMLTKYEEASLINARMAASKMMFFKDQPNAIGADYVHADKNESGEENVTDAGDVIKTISAGTAEYIGKLDVATFDPSYPHDQHEPFMRTGLRGFATGAGLCYNTFANDYASLSWSSVRTALQEERENWKAIQAWITESLLVPIFEDWLEMALLSGALKLPTYDVRKISRPKFTGRTWKYVDPNNDAKADLAEIQGGLASLDEKLAERGKDRDEIFEQLAADKKAAEDLGLTLTPFIIADAPADTEPTPAPVDPNKDPAAGPDDAADDGTKKDRHVLLKIANR